jgi:hypothetical protein
VTLSTYGRQFVDVPAGETVTITASALVNPIVITYVGATVDGKSISSVTMSNTSCVLTDPLTQMYTTTFTLTGQYSSDLATEDEFIAINTKNYISSSEDFEQLTYKLYDQLIAEKGVKWDQIIKFYPDRSPEKTVIYTFTGGIPTTVTQKVSLIPTRQFTRLQSIMQSISPNRVVTDASGNIITPGYSSDPPGFT